MGMEMSTVFAIGQLGMSALSGFSAMSQARAEQQQAIQQSELETQEIMRQQDQAALIAQEQKSDRAREADKMMGQMLALMADTGAAGTTNEARYVGENSFLAGLDLARIEGNRVREAEALNAEARRTQARALGTIQTSGARAQGAIWDVAATGLSLASKRLTPNPATQTTDPKRANVTYNTSYGNAQRYSGRRTKYGSLIKGGGRLGGGV